MQMRKGNCEKGYCRQTFRSLCWDINSGAPLRPKTARVEPHTHTIRHAGFFMVMASGMVRGRVRRTTVAFHDILT